MSASGLADRAESQTIRISAITPITVPAGAARLACNMRNGDPVVLANPSTGQLRIGKIVGIQHNDDGRHPMFRLGLGGWTVMLPGWCRLIMAPADQLLPPVWVSDLRRKGGSVRVYAAHAPQDGRPKFISELRLATARASVSFVSECPVRSVRHVALEYDASTAPNRAISLRIDGMGEGWHPVAGRLLLA